MAERMCSVDDCDRPVLARGWCSRCYQRWRAHGDPAGLPRLSPAERFWTRTFANGACRDWDGPPDAKGYGRTYWDGHPRLAHRVAFFLRMDRWPGPGLESRHLCNRPICILHVVEGTSSENEADKRAAIREAVQDPTYSFDDMKKDLKDLKTIVRTRIW